MRKGTRAMTDIRGDAAADPRRRPTIHDVARLAGVSTSTVSRVLDPRVPPSRSPAAARVRSAADSLGYTPHSIAASLRRQGTETIGVLVPRLTDTVMAITYEEVARACQARGYFAMVATTGDRPESERAAADSLLRRRVDGLVLSTARTGDPFLAELRERGTPHTLVLRTDGHSPSSLGDDELGGYLAARHLLDLGHRDVACVAGPAHTSSAAGRRAGYLRALAERGITPRPEWVIGSEFSMEAGEEAARALLDGDARPTAVFAVNDNTAVGVMSTALRRGLDVPGDLSIVGYNDIPLADRLPLPLTTMRVPFRDIAADAVDLLLSPPGEGEESVRVRPPTLIPRASTAPPRGPAD
ncbi:LacI family transcriptional regulator [Nocardiopsis flavescens]|uniref:LacI family transcriptional regulator n=2 Tax=Nocardiopsis flavescens TaxID=758803 RepID=A0A1M6W5W2_9ACTN|nr:LacI family transcriptional regulator [Nocardiopsis flavescens]